MKARTFAALVILGCGLYWVATSFGQMQEINRSSGGVSATVDMAAVTNALSAPNDATKYLDGTGAWSEPPGSGIDTNTIALLSGAAFTGPISAPMLTIDTARQNIRSDLTHAGTVTLDFATNTSQFLVLTGNVTFAASNLGTNRSYFVTIANAQATNCAVTMPAETIPMSFIPSAIAAGKHAWIFFTPHPQTNTLVFATFAEQP